MLLCDVQCDIHFLNRSVTEGSFRVERREYRMHGFKSNRSRIGTSKVSEKSCDNNFIFSLLENKTRDSDLLIRSLKRTDGSRSVS